MANLIVTAQGVLVHLKQLVVRRQTTAQTENLLELQSQAGVVLGAFDKDALIEQANTHKSPDTDAAPTSLHHTLGAGANQAAAGNHGHAGTMQALFTREGSLSATSGTMRIYNNYGSTKTISKVMIAVNTPPTGAAIIVDVHKNGTTIFTNQANRPQIAAGANTGDTTTIDVSSFADGDYLTMDVDQVGSTIVGADLTAHIIYG